ncbi:MAG: DNA mismatch endonuclease Vsr [Clostridia bacterium]|nr:DNA mismatch endonuclease Vsr [Clostridia bacterium]
MDVHDKETRSYNMSRIKGKKTKPEELVAKYLFAHGFRYRRNVKSLPGTPDIVLKKYKTVIFVNGCFWHMHAGCKYFVWPENNADFWEKKLLANKKRDEEKIKQLELLGWRVITVWECELKPHILESSLETLFKKLEKIYANDK